MLSSPTAAQPLLNEHSMPPRRPSPPEISPTRSAATVRRLRSVCGRSPVSRFRNPASTKQLANWTKRLSSHPLILKSQRTPRLPGFARATSRRPANWLLPLWPQIPASRARKTSSGASISSAATSIPLSGSYKLLSPLMMTLRLPTFLALLTCEPNASRRPNDGSNICSRRWETPPLCTF